MVATVNKVMAMMKQAPGMMVVKDMMDTPVMVVLATVMVVVEVMATVVRMMRGVVV